MGCECPFSIALFDVAEVLAPALPPCPLFSHSLYISVPGEALTVHIFMPFPEAGLRAD